MKKEILFAILAGSIFGLIVAFGFWRLNSSLTKDDNTSSMASPTPSPEVGITIAKPIENQVFTNSKVKITGLSAPNAWVVAVMDEADFVTQADATGSFEIEVTLEGGINEIMLYGINDSGKKAEALLTLIYSSEFTPKLEGEKNEKEATDAVRQKVQEKLDEALNIPVAFIGTVTDITELSFQIKNGSEEILQAATSKETDFVNTINSPKTIELADVAIGDFIVAMGYKDANGVLMASRLLVSKKSEANVNKIFFGTIEKIEKFSVTLTDENVTLSFPKTWKGPDLDELSEGEKLIAVGEPTGNEVEVRSIFSTSSEN